MVNWCPSCQTVLANEQVVSGNCERCGTAVVQKALNQWYFKITHYKDELIEGLKEVDWPEATKIQQLNWIGKRNGVEVRFPMEGVSWLPEAWLSCFTTRIDTIYGVTYLVIAPEVASKWIAAGWEADETVKSYIDIAFHKTEEHRKVGKRKKQELQLV